MANIVVESKDGSKREFMHQGRAGGSFTKTVRYEGDMVVVEDEWANTWAFPTSDVKEVKTTPHRSYF